MLLSDSQISMRPICSNMLFTPLDYIFLSYLVGVCLRACSRIFICIIFSLLYLYYEGVIQFFVVTWAMGLKSGSNPSNVGTTLKKIVLGRWQALS